MLFLSAFVWFVYSRKFCVKSLCRFLKVFYSNNLTFTLKTLRGFFVLKTRKSHKVWPEDFCLFNVIFEI